MTEQSLSERSIFEAAIEKSSPEERAAYLDQVCGRNEGLRKEVEALLAAHHWLGGGRPLATIDEPRPSEAPGTVIGPYKLLQQIGEGGMGTVFMAEQTQPVKRKVALKVIKPGMDSRQVIARFEAERQALALMDHVNIARVLDAGATDSGRPYFVMELVHGVPITKYCDDHQLTPRQRLELFVPVCQAIQHAHQKGIIHRDVKPSNVMVTLYDGKPVPKVIDFGVAKATEHNLTERTLFTQYGTMVGTLEYMSPEQAEMSALGIDTRSDIYSLGVLLYELLTGSTPLTRKRLKEAAYAEVLRLIKEEEPPRPSTRLSESGEALASISVQRHMEPAKLSKLMRGELDWIVMKTLEKDRNRRYETANGLAADVQRYLNDETVQACPPSAWYRFGKFARRNRRALASAAVLGLAVLVAAGTLGWALRERDAQAQAAVRESADRQVRITARVDQILADVDALEQEEKWEEALATARRAEAVLAAGDAAPATSERARRAVADLDLVRRLEKIRARAGAVWDPAVPRLRAVPADRDYAAEFRTAGIDGDAVTVTEGVAWLATRPATRAALLAALDDWALSRLTVRGEAAARRLTDVAQAADADPWRKQLREATLRKDAALLDRLAASPDLDRQPAASVSLLITGLRTLRNSGKSEIKVLRRVQVQHSADFWINLRLGTSLIWSGQPEEGMGYVRAAVALRPRAPNAVLNLGNGFEKLGRYDEAADCHRRAIELDPTFALAYNNLGLILQKQSRPAEAVANYSKAIALDPKCSSTWFNRGNAYHNLGQTNKAIADYSKAIELDPKYVLPWTNRGVVYSTLGQTGKAIADFSKAIELDPKHALNWANRAIVYKALGQMDKAIADYSKAIELDPKSASAWYSRGNAYHDLGQTDKAIADYSKAIELDPKYVLAWYNRALTYQGLGQTDKAIADYSKAITLAPKRAVLHNNLAWLLATCPDAKLRDPVKAVASAKKAVELAPHGNHWNTLGVASYRVGDWKAAIQALNKSMELRQGGDSFDWFFLAMAHYQLGDKKDARKWYDKAVAWKEKNASKNEELGRFRAEAQKLLELKK